MAETRKLPAAPTVPSEAREGHSRAQTFITEGDDSTRLEGTIEANSILRARANSEGKWKTINRLRGFFLSVDKSQKEAKVAFVIKGKVVEYILPYEGLKERKIKTAFQPFEMEELEWTGPEISATGHRFTALAPHTSGKREPFNLDPELSKWRDSAG